jgi:uncharacterized protein YoxC
MTKIYLILALVGILSAGAVGLFVYVKRLETSLEQSRENVSKLETGIEIQKDTIKNMQSDVKVITTINQQVNQRIQEQNQSIRELSNKFTQSSSNRERDFGKLASEKPLLIEKIINQATARARRCMELTMGAELNEQEKNDQKMVKDLSSCSN